MKLKKNGNESTITETKKNLINNQCDIIEKNIKQNNFYVYALVNPITNLPFYIGKGKNNRDKSHIRDVRYNKIPHGNKHLFYTIKNIIDSGLNVIMQHLDIGLSEQDAFLKECEYIKKYGRKDLEQGILTNLTDGGEGQSGWNPTIEYRDKMSISTSGSKNGMYGKKHTLESKELMIKKAIGRKQKDSVKEMKSLKMMGKNNHFYGKKHTPETILKLKENSIKRNKYGCENKSYVNLDSVKQLIIDEYNKKTNLSEITRIVNKNGIECSRVAIKRRLVEWDII